MNCLLVLEPFRAEHHAHRCDLFQFHEVCVLRVDKLVRHNVVELSYCLLRFLLRSELNKAKSLKLAVGVTREFDIPDRATLLKQGLHLFSRHFSREVLTIHCGSVHSLQIDLAQVEWHSSLEFGFALTELEQLARSDCLHH